MTNGAMAAAGARTRKEKRPRLGKSCTAGPPFLRANICNIWGQSKNAWANLPWPNSFCRHFCSDPKYWVSSGGVVNKPCAEILVPGGM